MPVEILSADKGSENASFPKSWPQKKWGWKLQTASAKGKSKGINMSASISHAIQEQQSHWTLLWLKNYLQHPET